MNHTATSLLASLLLASPALAGITFSTSIERMAIGVGYVDVGEPDPIASVDSAFIDQPPEGSFLLMGGTVPGVDAFAASLTLTGTPAGRADFSFANTVSAVDFGSTVFEYTISGSRVTITSDSEVLVSLTGTLEGSGAAVAAINVLGGVLPPHFFTVTGDPVSYALLLPAGTHTIGWGAIVGPSGGTAGFEGTVSFIAVPAPGTALLVVAAGALVATRRRRA